MKKEATRLIRPILFAAAGALVGYLYYRFIGCASGTCAITSKPLNSMVYFGFMGLLLSGVFCPSCRGGSCDITKNDTNKENKSMSKKLYVVKARCPQNHPCPSIRVCPTGALSQVGYSAPIVDYDKCIACGKCSRFCPMGALELREEE